MVKRKNASLVFCCEPAMMKAIMNYGATYEEALNYDIRGCGTVAGEGIVAQSQNGNRDVLVVVQLFFGQSRVPDSL